jgi:hypothetical protein
MSHVVTCELVVKDLESLAKASEQLGMELMIGQKNWKFYGRWVDDYHAEDAAYKHGIKPADYGKCDHAIRVKNNDQAYEIGLLKQADGSFKMVWDFFAGGHGLMDKVGTDCGKLRQEYAAQVAIKHAKKQGFSVTRKVTSDGKLQLLCR